ncbi:hypothetical protein GPECTOR_20g502 [Gonium pectorale]|uniref:CBM20 domain-containing protein n=1 Tax=Gonium pectorale TaxID=33097 RepID=A0A150GIV9_GONPE|nr:hypothetical protein GPECTOR_20g502 [Gonium pectorale]|eukprot:KXZ49645.1 hypothetical protein GPECTOR_20g502 [Gonium pectorale]
MVTVSFKVQYKCNFGQTVSLVGDSTELGRWSAQQGVRMRWSKGDTWTCSVKLPAGSSLECKYVIVDEKGAEVRWQEGSNMALKVPASYHGSPVDSYDVHISWCQAHAAFSAIPARGTSSKSSSSAAGSSSTTSSSRSTSVERAERLPVAAAAAAAAAPSGGAAPVAAWVAAKGTGRAASPLRKATAAEPEAVKVAPPAPQPVAEAAPISLAATIRQAAANAAQAPAQPAAAAAASAPATAAPATAVAPARPAFQVTPPSGEEPMSLVLPPRSTSPPFKISLSPSFSSLMDLPGSPRERVSGNSASAGSAGDAGSPSQGSGGAAAATSWSSVTGKAPAAAIRSHPIDAAPVSSGLSGAASPPSSPARSSPTSSPSSSKAAAAVRNDGAAVPPPVVPSPAAASFGLEYDIYSAFYETPYMHTPFDLDAYAVYEHGAPEPVAPGSSSSGGPMGLGDLLNRSTDFVESAVRTAASHGGTAAFANGAASPAAPAAAPAEVPTPAAAPSPSSEPYRQTSRSSPAVSDWASRTLFELSSGRSLLEEDEDSDDEEETADEEAALVHAMAAPVSPADMAALLTQLGTALGRSVRLRYEGMDVAASDLLELDRKIALAASKLYRQRDSLLTGWVRKETRRQLATAAAVAAPSPPRSPGSRAGVTPL